MTVGELSGVIGLIVAVAGAGAAWGAHRAQARAHARELAELRGSRDAMGRRLGGLKTAVAILAAKQDLVERLAPYLDGGGRRPTAPRGFELANLSADSGEHETTE